MTTLIIGHLGYVGSAIHARMPDAKGVDRAGLMPPAMDYRWLTTAFYDQYNTVIWMAGHSTVKGCIADPCAAYYNNLGGLVDLVRKLRKGQRLIYASSGSVYGAKDNMYDATKRAADDMLPLLYPNVVGLRFGTVAGPSPATRFDTMINGMTRDALTTGVIKARNANIWRPILGIGDLCRAVERCMTDAIKPGIYDLYSFSGSVAMFAHEIAGLTGAKVEWLENSPSYDFVMAGEYLPRIPPRDHLASIVKELRESIERKEAA